MNKDPKKLGKLLPCLEFSRRPERSPHLAVGFQFLHHRLNFKIAANLVVVLIEGVHQVPRVGHLQVINLRRIFIVRELLQLLHAATLKVPADVVHIPGVLRPCLHADLLVAAIETQVARGEGPFGSLGEVAPRDLVDVDRAPRVRHHNLQDRVPLGELPTRANVRRFVDPMDMEVVVDGVL